MEKKEEETEEITLEEYLIYSGRNGDLEGLQTCLQEHVNINTKNEYGNTALRITQSEHTDRHGSSQWTCGYGAKITGSWGQHRRAKRGQEHSSP